MRTRRGFDATVRKMVEVRRALRASEVAFLATRGAPARAAHRDDRVAVFLQCQGCEVLDGELWRLDALYELGLSVLQITHHHDNTFGGGALMKATSGLTELARAASRRWTSWA